MTTGAFDHTERLRALSDRGLAHLDATFLAAARDFDPAQAGGDLLFPEAMTWFHGEPVYQSLSAAARIKLNHLTFCHYYFLTLNAEAAANVLNHHASLLHLRAEPDAAFYMAREATEESFHIETFHILVRKVLAHHEVPLAVFWEQSSIRMSRWFYGLHTLLAWVRGNHDAYYFSRFPLNIGTKIAERSILKEPKLHATVREIVRAHSIDEARHMRMSRETGKLALARVRSRTLRAAIGALYAHYASGLNVLGRQADRRFPVTMLTLCGVPEAEAEAAYRAWRDRVHQAEDPPEVRRMRRYYLRQNLAYVEELALPAWVRRYVGRVLRRAYRDVAEPVTPGSPAPQAGAADA